MAHDVKDTSGNLLHVVDHYKANGEKFTYRHGGELEEEQIKDSITISTHEDNLLSDIDAFLKKVKSASECFLDSRVGLHVIRGITEYRIVVSGWRPMTLAEKRAKEAYLEEKERELQEIRERNRNREIETLRELVEEFPEEAKKLKEGLV